MREVHLHRLDRDEKRPCSPELTDHLYGLLHALQQVSNQGVKVYRTFVPKDDKQRPYTFMTTSKDIHLALGKLSQEGQLHLARLLKLEFEFGEFNELLLYPEKDGHRGCMLVTCQIADDADMGWCFHICPAY